MDIAKIYNENKELIENRKKVLNNNKKTLWQIKDGYKTGAKYPELWKMACTIDVPKKYIDTYKTYYHSYYFTNEQKCDEFYEILYKKYKELNL